ncbi:unnamed protein product [Acanthoscelides obtectus]|uniref:DDE Tnp4 domain-containing protein n=1 Tax=Acanthoscelides obtectus TaxID=200917 RepID=A0A9P0JNV8_ACAOB|nr:unnamed protein product [Acanthoscelides obtectus]CAK1639673.1 hypothetical protein AOBTE_LOCUS11308 [Acanthoscelides obtectus]
MVPEVCKAINSVLKDQIKLPQTPEEWLHIEEGFRHKFPRCVGAIDGKHIVINRPAHSGSKFYNFKGEWLLETNTNQPKDFSY